MAFAYEKLIAEIDAGERLLEVGDRVVEWTDKQSGVEAEWILTLTTETSAGKRVYYHWQRKRVGQQLFDCHHDGGRPARVACAKAACSSLAPSNYDMA